MSSSSARTNGLCEKAQNNMAVCRNNIQFKDYRSSILSFVFAIGKTLTVESSVGGEGVCGFVLTKQLPYRYLWANANTKGSRGLLLKAIPLQNYERLANVPLRSMENHQAERKKKKIILQIWLRREG